MTITGEQLLLENGGKIEPSHFPDDKPLNATGAIALEDRLESYAVEANAKVADLLAADFDRAAFAWAYYLAYTAIAVRLSNTAASMEAPGEGSRSILATQINFFKDLAAEQKAIAEAVLATLLTPSGQTLPYPSQSHQASIHW